MVKLRFITKKNTIWLILTIVLIIGLGYYTYNSFYSSENFNADEFAFGDDAVRDAIDTAVRDAIDTAVRDEGRGSGSGSDSGSGGEKPDRAIVDSVKDYEIFVEDREEVKNDKEEIV